MFRSLIWYVYFPIGLLIHLPWALKLERNRRNGKISEDEFYIQSFDLANSWSKQYLKIAAMQVEIIGEENIIKDRPCLFVSNHQSNFDIAVILRYLGTPIIFIAKNSLTKIPILSRLMKNMSTLFIDRNDIKASAKVMLKAMDYVKEGHSIFVYPEGTRGDSPEMSEFPSTAIKIATKTGVPICPITMSGTYDAMEGTNNIITPAKVRMYVHPPIETADLTKEQKKTLHKDVYEIVKSELVFDLNKDRKQKKNKK